MPFGLSRAGPHDLEHATTNMSQSFKGQKEGRQMLIFSTIKDFVESHSGALTAKSVATHLQTTIGVTLSLVTVRKMLKHKLGMRYRRIYPVTAPMNTSRCKILRQTAAFEFIEALHSGKTIINVDESLIAATDQRKYSWQKRGQHTMQVPSARMSQVSLIMGVSSRGEFYFTSNRGSNNGETITLFLLKLIAHLDAIEPTWRDTTVILMDNAPYHKGFAFRAAMRTLRVPIAYLGPYQFRMAPVELCFGFLKKFDLNPGDLRVTTMQAFACSRPYRNQGRGFLPHLNAKILQLDWTWIPQAFRHCLAAALDFVSLKEL